jgi:AcrR family transcriptional regulator
VGQVSADVIVSRRDRVRAATSQEIIQTARRLLVEEGSAAVSLRAIAREMGMTAPAIYRYFDSYEKLIQHVVAGIFTDLSDYVETAVAAAVRDAATAQAEIAQSAADAQTYVTATGLITACQSFRDWAAGHKAEFGMIFGSPLPGVDLLHDDPLVECGTRFGRIYLTLLTDLWQVKPFEIPADDALDPSIREQIVIYRDHIGTDLPLGVLQVFLRCWVLLYGTVTLEVFGHLRFALADSRGMFDLMLTDLAAMIGLEYPKPGDCPE